MTPEDFARETWQASGSAPALPSMEELRGRSDAFRRKIDRRNMIEFVAGGVVLAAFGAYLVFLPGWPIKLASAMIIVATIYVLRRLHRDGSNRPLPESAGLTGLIAFRRAELVRQRDLIDGVFGWYLAPFIPGMALFLASPALMGPVADLSKLGGPAAFAALVFFVIWRLNKMAAAKLSREIAELDALAA